MISIDECMYIMHTKNCQAILDLLPTLAKTLKVSTDELIGFEKPEKNSKTQDTRLRRPAWLTEPSEIF